MSWSELVHKSFGLWWKTLSAVLVFNFTSALLNGWTFLFHQRPQLNTTFVLISLFVLCVNLIPANAVFAKLGHAAENTPISLSQSLAVALLRFPRTLAWFGIIIALVYIPIYFLMGHFVVNGNEAEAVPFVLMLLVYMLFIMVIGLYFLFVFPLIVNENYSLIDALKKSYALIKGRWWFTGFIISIPIFFTVIMQRVLMVFLGEIGAMIGITLFASLNMAAIVILYKYYLSIERKAD